MTHERLAVVRVFLLLFFFWNAGDKKLNTLTEKDYLQILKELQTCDVLRDDDLRSFGFQLL